MVPSKMPPLENAQPRIADVALNVGPGLDRQIGGFDPAVDLAATRTRSAVIEPETSPRSATIRVPQRTSPWI
jgi:hypothetical protein